MASKLQSQGDESVVLRVSHSNIKSFSTDIRFSLQSTIEAAKEKLWRKCGTSVEAMKLELYDDTGVKVSDLSDNTRAIGFYDPQDGVRGQRYLKYPPLCGAMVRPDKVLVCLCALLNCFQYIDHTRLQGWL